MATQREPQKRNGISFCNNAKNAIKINYVKAKIVYPRKNNKCWQCVDKD